MRSVFLKEFVNVEFSFVLSFDRSSGSILKARLELE